MGYTIIQNCFQQDLFGIFDHALFFFMVDSHNNSLLKLCISPERDLPIHIAVLCEAQLLHRKICDGRRKRMQPAKMSLGIC